jgi:hypothetical protein
MIRSSPAKTRKGDFLQISTPPSHECWWRIEVKAEDLAWIQKNLGHGMDYRKRLLDTSSLASLPGSCPWTERVSLREGENAPRVLVSLGDSYNYHSAYAKARDRRDPHLSPHGLFRNLEAGYHKHAFQFMQKFGPLFIKSSTRYRGDSWWLSLADFWNRHARFVAVAKLWEDRFDPNKLREHWDSLGEQHQRLDRAGVAPLGYIPDRTQKYIQLYRMPWQLKQNLSPFPGAKAVFQQKLVYNLVYSELILHTQDCVLTWTATNRPTANPSDATVFEPIRCFTSLWGVIWEQFGLDTRSGWRLCRECGKLFYPKDPRSVCCSTEHQSLWSKREWAREHRIAMGNAKVKKVRQRP